MSQSKMTEAEKLSAEAIPQSTIESMYEERKLARLAKEVLCPSPSWWIPSKAKYFRFVSPDLLTTYIERLIEGARLRKVSLDRHSYMLAELEPCLAGDPSRINYLTSLFDLAYIYFYDRFNHRHQKGYLYQIENPYECEEERMETYYEPYAADLKVSPDFTSWLSVTQGKLRAKVTDLKYETNFLFSLAHYLQNLIDTDSLSQTPLPDELVHRSPCEKLHWVVFSHYVEYDKLYTPRHEEYEPCIGQIPLDRKESSNSIFLKGVMDSATMFGLKTICRRKSDGFPTYSNVATSYDYYAFSELGHPSLHGESIRISDTISWDLYKHYQSHPEDLTVHAEVYGGILKFIQDWRPSSDWEKDLAAARAYKKERDRQSEEAWWPQRRTIYW